MPDSKKDPSLKILIAIGTILALAGTAYLIKAKMGDGRAKSGVKWNKSGEYLKSRYQKTKRH
ncbi:MAG TPA: hypothetical protein ENK02_04725 [Planctomycetes bacterium]|nr:hypothetical protein [Planctomycetota bacterium]